jgi:hypothetical protein
MAGGEATANLMPYMAGGTSLGHTRGENCDKNFMQTPRQGLVCCEADNIRYKRLHTYLKALNKEQNAPLVWCILWCETISFLLYSLALCQLHKLPTMHDV